MSRLPGTQKKCGGDEKKKSQPPSVWPSQEAARYKFVQTSTSSAYCFFVFFFSSSRRRSSTLKKRNEFRPDCTHGSCNCYQIQIRINRQVKMYSFVRGANKEMDSRVRVLCVIRLILLTERFRFLFFKRKVSGPSRGDSREIAQVMKHEQRVHFDFVHSLFGGTTSSSWEMPRMATERNSGRSGDRAPSDALKKCFELLSALVGTGEDGRSGDRRRCSKKGKRFHSRPRKIPPETQEASALVFAGAFYNEHKRSGKNEHRHAHIGVFGELVCLCAPHRSPDAATIPSRNGYVRGAIAGRMCASLYRRLLFCWFFRRLKKTFKGLRRRTSRCTEKRPPNDDDAAGKKYFFSGYWFLFQHVVYDRMSRLRPPSSF